MSRMVNSSFKVIYLNIEYMSNYIDDSIYFDRKVVKEEKWLEKNPYEVLTDRESFVLKHNCQYIEQCTLGIVHYSSIKLIYN